MQAGEAELVRRARAGDTDAFGELVRAHQRFVYNLALRVVGEEAEDVVQETFVRAWLGLARYRGETSLRTWLYRIATNECYRRLPRLRRDLAALGESALELLPDETTADLAAGVEAEERRRYLHRQIAGLPRSYRLLITLRYQDELPYDEIAGVLGLPLGTVKTGLFRARARLREALRVYEEAPA